MSFLEGFMETLENCAEGEIYDDPYAAAAFLGYVNECEEEGEDDE